MNLIRREKRVRTDRNGTTTVQHWDGRKDVHVVASNRNVTVNPNLVGRRKKTTDG